MRCLAAQDHSSPVLMGGAGAGRTEVAQDGRPAWEEVKAFNGESQFPYRVASPCLWPGLGRSPARGSHYPEAPTSFPCSPVLSPPGEGLPDPLGTFEGPWAGPAPWLGALIK